MLVSRYGLFLNKNQFTVLGIRTRNYLLDRRRLFYHVSVPVTSNLNSCKSVSLLCCKKEDSNLLHFSFKLNALPNELFLRVCSPVAGKLVVEGGTPVFAHSFPALLTRQRTEHSIHHSYYIAIKILLQHQKPVNRNFCCRPHGTLGNRYRYCPCCSSYFLGLPGVPGCLSGLTTDQ